eukprot:3523474-Rhodomonas_salina.2
MPHGCRTSGRGSENRSATRPNAPVPAPLSANTSTPKAVISCTTSSKASTSLADATRRYA